MTLFFDMDGTITNLYGIDNWLECLQCHNANPYRNAKPLPHLSSLARRLNNCQAEGIRLGIISWLAKNSTPEFDAEVTAAKLAWLKKHLPSVRWDEIHIVAYGTPKENYCSSANDILIDDEEKNRMNWTGRAFSETEMFVILKELV